MCFSMCNCVSQASDKQIDVSSCQVWCTLQECARLMGATDAAAARAPAFQYKLLLYTLLSGNRIIAEQVLQVHTCSFQQ